MTTLPTPPGFPIGPPPAPPLGSLPWPPEIGAAVSYRRVRTGEAIQTTVELARVAELGSGDLRIVRLKGIGWAPWDRCSAVGVGS